MHRWNYLWTSSYPLSHPLAAPLVLILVQTAPQFRIVGHIVTLCLLLLILDGLYSIDTVASDPHHLLILAVGVILNHNASMGLLSVGFPHIERGALVDALRVLLALGDVFARLVDHELLLALLGSPSSCSCYSACISVVGVFSVLVDDAL